MRGKRAPKRKINPDVRYKNVQISKFINYVMKDGKKRIAQTIVYGALDIVKEKSKQDPVEVFDKAMKNAAPNVEVRGRRIGGANYQVPVQVRSERRFVLASRWIIEAARKRKGRDMRTSLAQELMDAAQNTGDTIKKKTDVHKMADANRAFAHFARF